MGSESWLDLHEAAKILSLHPSTLRRWADSGKVPHSRTISGRRRFDRSVIERLQQEAQRVAAPQPSLQMASKALEMTRQHVRDLSQWQQGWLSHLSEEQTLIFRYSGQRLLGLLMQYISRNEDAASFLDESKRIAVDYGRLFHKAGLSAAQSAETFLYFRRSILASVHSAAGYGQGSAENDLRVFLKTSDFFDAFLVAMVESQTRPATPESP